MLSRTLCRIKVQPIHLDQYLNITKSFKIAPCINLRFLSDSSTAESKPNGKGVKENKIQKGKLIFDIGIKSKLFPAMQCISTGFVLYSVVSTIPTSIALTSFLSFGMSLTLSTLQWFVIYSIVRNSILFLYHNDETDTYSAHVASWHIWPYKIIKFTPKDCVVTEKQKSPHYFKVNENTLFIDRFKFGHDKYYRMLRYTDDYEFLNNAKKQEEAMQAAFDKVNNKIFSYQNYEINQKNN